MSERENGQLPLAERAVRSRISADVWQQVKTAYAGGIGLQAHGEFVEMLGDLVVGAVLVGPGALLGSADHEHPEIHRVEPCQPGQRQRVTREQAPP